MGRSIYVEARVHGPIEEVWEKTQDPALHRRWDLRFTDIEYLPREGAHRPQRFRYATRIGFGLGIEGTGETTGSKGKAEDRTSALSFASADRKSLILEGSGYWRYLATPGGVRFLTRYDYRTRFGRLGRLLDLAFRPLLGWATALSFDRLRLWVEKGTPPEASMRQWWVHALCRLALAFVFLYQGLVPKVLSQSPDELAMARAAGVPDAWAPSALVAVGVAETAYALLLLAGWRWRWPLLAVVPAMLAVAVGVAATAPGYVASAFNVVSLNAAVLALGLAGWLAAKDVPSARHCLRRPPEGSA